MFFFTISGSYFVFSIVIELSALGSNNGKHFESHNYDDL